MVKRLPGAFCSTFTAASCCRAADIHPFRVICSVPARSLRCPHFLPRYGRDAVAARDSTTTLLTTPQPQTLPPQQLLGRWRAAYIHHAVCYFELCIKYTQTCIHVVHGKICDLFGTSSLIPAIQKIKHPYLTLDTPNKKHHTPSIYHVFFSPHFPKPTTTNKPHRMSSFLHTFLNYQPHFRSHKCFPLRYHWPTLKHKGDGQRDGATTQSPSQ
ncbi:uncharacterized protein LOC123514344 [Portunus trituberculatus]|uniref:uncharacterized protein LOC123514344 n=1 Tax=Portunus trituberculatus TaxID=210409 RepID=UPI001E1CFA36|nr:uncharacterized protein LOC123514344 [Portunus trituberculatus]